MGLVMLCSSRMLLEHTTEKMVSMSGPFIKWSLRKTIKKKSVVETPARVFLFASVLAHSVMN